MLEKALFDIHIIDSKERRRNGKDGFISMIPEPGEYTLPLAKRECAAG